MGVPSFLFPRTDLDRGAGVDDDLPVATAGFSHCRRLTASHVSHGSHLRRFLIKTIPEQREHGGSGFSLTLYVKN